MLRREAPSLGEMIGRSTRATSTLCEFAQASVCPLFGTTEEQSYFHSAAMTTFNRMTLWLSDLAANPEPIRFQIAAVCCRSIFEHLVDLRWLIDNPGTAESFHHFTAVSRFQTAEKIRIEVDAFPNLDWQKLTAQMRLANDSQSRAVRDELCRRNGWVTKGGRPRPPLHWWGENARQRTLAIDPKKRKYLRIYLALFASMSSLVHSGAAGVQDISAKGFAGLFIGTHVNSQRFFLEACELVMDQFDAPAAVRREYADKFGHFAPYGSPNFDAPVAAT